MKYEFDKRVYRNAKRNKYIRFDATVYTDLGWDKSKFSLITNGKYRHLNPVDVRELSEYLGVEEDDLFDVDWEV